MRNVVAWLAGLGLVLGAMGCSSGTSGMSHDGGHQHEGGYPDTGSLFVDVGPNAPECNDGIHICDFGETCAAVMGVPRCVPDPNPPPPGDGTHCEPCPAPGQCRMSVCIQPTPGGGLCEFDSICGPGQFCISGSCTPDPRVPVPCSDMSMCAPGFTCVAGTCHCTHTSDCPSGFECVDGACTPGTGCVADTDCPTGDVCEAGTCRPGTVCDITAPDFSGDWPAQVTESDGTITSPGMHSTLRLRESLPSWLSDLLNAIEGPLLFLAGDRACIDFGLPMWVEDAICAAIAPYVGDALPPWAPPLFRAIGHLNDVLNTWEVDEHMTLTAGSVPDSYRGTHTWDRVSFVYAGTTIVGDPLDPTMGFDWMFTPSPFNASTTCGVFNIDRHTVHVSIGAIVAWLVDAVIYEASDHAYRSLMDVLTAIASSFCSGLADAAEAAVPDYPGVAGTVHSVCTGALSTLVSTAVNAVVNARIGVDPITLRGTAQIGGPNSLVMGHWDGTLVGSGFTGDWQAVR